MCMQCTLCHIEVANLSGGNCESTGGKSYSLFGEVIFYVILLCYNRLTLVAMLVASERDQPWLLYYSISMFCYRSYVGSIAKVMRILKNTDFLRILHVMSGIEHCTAISISDQLTASIHTDLKQYVNTFLNSTCLQWNYS